MEKESHDRCWLLSVAVNFDSEHMRAQGITSRMLSISSERINKKNHRGSSG